MKSLFLFYLSALLLLNYGAQMLRFPPVGFGVPLAELFLLYFFLRMNLKCISSKINAKIPLVFYWLWFVYAICLVIIGAFEHGAVAIRDGSPVIESLYLFVGFYVAQQFIDQPQRLEIYVSCFGVAVIVYLLLYPVKNDLQDLLASLENTQGIATPIFFHYISTPTIAIATATFWMYKFECSNKTRFFIGSAALLVLCLAYLPSRTLLLQLVFFVGFVYLTLKAKGKFYFSVLLAVTIIGLVIVIGGGYISETRLGEGASLDSYFSLLREIFDPTYEGGGASSSNRHRIGWWTKIIEDVAASVSSFFFGLGYGVVLTDLVLKGDVIVREPHNDLISVFARSGIVGLSLFIVAQWIFIRAALNAFVNKKTMPIYRGASIWIGVFISCVWIFSLGESPFVQPFFAVPYYFFLGVLFRMLPDRNISPKSVKSFAALQAQNKLRNHFSRPPLKRLRGVRHDWHDFPQ